MPTDENRESPFRGRKYTIKGSKDSTLDVFHMLLTMPWWALLLVTFLLYVTLVLIFAGLYAMDPEGVGPNTIKSASERDVFLDVFFLSVQTLSTIGYGHLAPLSGWANMVALVESFMGIVFTAMVTGSLFAKLSRPVARVVFARRVLLQRNPNGFNDLVFRIVNQRQTPILNMKPGVSVLIRAGGSEPSFAYKSLALEVTNISLFVGGARLRHTINEQSPLWGFNAPEDAARLGVFSFLAIVQGTEEVYGHQISNRKIYDPTDVLVGYRFKRLLDEDPATGALVVHLDRLNELEPLHTRTCGLASV